MLTVIINYLIFYYYKLNENFKYQYNEFHFHFPINVMYEEFVLYANMLWLASLIFIRSIYYSRQINLFLRSHQSILFSINASKTIGEHNEALYIWDYLSFYKMKEKLCWI